MSILDYTKKFIILKNDFCNIPGKKAKGHGKIEARGIKGSLSLSVENAEESQCYDVDLIWGNRNFNLGKIYTDKYGKGRDDISFNISELESSGIKLERASGLVIAREDNVLLGGYMGREDQSLERYIKNLKVHESSDEPMDVKEFKTTVIEKSETEVLEEEEVEVEEVLDEEILVDEEVIDDKEITQDEILDLKESIGEQDNISKDELDIETKVDPKEDKAEIKVEFIRAEEFEECPESDEEFFQTDKEIDEIKNDDLVENNISIEEDVKTYVRSTPDSIDKDIICEKASDDNEDDYGEYEEIAAIKMDRVIGLEEIDMDKAIQNDDDKYVETEFSEDDILFETDEPIYLNQKEDLECTHVDLDKKVGEDETILQDEVRVEEATNLEDEIISLDEAVVGENILNDVGLVEDSEEEINLEDYDKEIIEQYESVFEPEPVESNEEVIKISHVDYEHNRRVIQRNQTTDYILNILKYFPKEDPFKQNLKGYKWWRIDFQDEAKGFLPYFNYVTGGKQKLRKVYDSTTAKELMSIYSHYLFGMYIQSDEVKYYIYGVPGGFYKDEHPYGGATGFNTWYSGNETIGYWLLYVDSLTGDVIYPINPMTPMD
ncbi:hypothetical protein E9840_11305 [Tissierella creatinini]|nr:hypothetical protein E9840_11305 [Tissierella creatinini]TJX59646.1 hypothetical protein E8P77_21045 [Soehngenia saccharolytica]